MVNFLVDRVFLSFSLAFWLLWACVKQIFSFKYPQLNCKSTYLIWSLAIFFCNKFKIQIQLIHWFIVEFDALSLSLSLYVSLVNILNMTLKKIHISFVLCTSCHTSPNVVYVVLFFAPPWTTSARFFWGPITFISLVRSRYTHSVKQKKLIFFFELVLTHRHSFSISVTEQSEIFY